MSTAITTLTCLKQTSNSPTGSSALYVYVPSHVKLHYHLVSAQGQKTKESSLFRLPLTFIKSINKPCWSQLQIHPLLCIFITISMFQVTVISHMDNHNGFLTDLSASTIAP